MSTMMNTKEIAHYLGIHEKQVYALIKAKKIPCTRVTGKWLFPKDLIDRWIIGDAEKNIRPFLSSGGKKKIALIAAGSNDPVLDILLSSIKLKKQNYYFFSSNTGSMEGLRLLKDNVTDIAWCHLFDPKSGSYNIPFITSDFSSSDITVIHLFYRELGFVTLPGLEKDVESFKDLTGKDILFINRQKGSGTRVLLEYFLAKEKIDHSEIKGFNDEVFTHFEVGMAVKSGKANVGIAAAAVANLFNLKFIPIVKESFDMVLFQSTFFKKGIINLIDTLTSDEFKKSVKALGNYDFRESGKIIYPG